MEAKMIQVKQNPGSTSPTTDLAFEQVMTIIKSTVPTNSASTSKQASTSTGSAVTTSNASPGKEQIKYSFHQLRSPLYSNHFFIHCNLENLI